MAEAVLRGEGVRDLGGGHNSGDGVRGLQPGTLVSPQSRREKLRCNE